MHKINFYLIIFSIFLTSCQSIKDGLSGRKSENSDEFLVKKKNPLVMPPKFMELPKPKEEIFESEISVIDETNNIENIPSSILAGSDNKIIFKTGSCVLNDSPKFKCKILLM